MKALLAFAFLFTLLALSACSSADNPSRYNYNWVYGMACGSQIMINGAPWQDMGGSIAVEGGRAPVHDLVIEKLIGNSGDGSAIPDAVAAENGSRRAKADLERTRGPLLGQCVKSARYLARINGQYGFTESAKSWAALASFLGKFKSYQKAAQAR